MLHRVETKLVSLPKPAMFKAAAKAVQKVAAYARVSTDREEQETSLTAQTDYYKKKITEHPGWEFVEIYVDDGVSGLSTSRREGFNHMVEDCLAGRIDLVLTKSISRFARNTVDTVTTIRKLKEKGVSVYFEKENIFTGASTGDVQCVKMIQRKSPLCGVNSQFTRDFIDSPVWKPVDFCRWSAIFACCMLADCSGCQSV